MGQHYPVETSVPQNTVLHYEPKYVGYGTQQQTQDLKDQSVTFQQDLVALDGT